MSEQVFIWASWPVASAANIIGMIGGEDAPYIQAFTDIYDDDGKGFHPESDGALLWLEPTTKVHGARVCLAIPASDWVQYKEAVFSPSEFGEEADLWGMSTMYEIRKEIKEAETQPTQGA